MGRVPTYGSDAGKAPVRYVGEMAGELYGECRLSVFSAESLAFVPEKKVGAMG